MLFPDAEKRHRLFGHTGKEQNDLVERIKEKGTN